MADMGRCLQICPSVCNSKVVATVNFGRLDPLSLGKCVARKGPLLEGQFTS
jgi:hypothetical protein